MLGGLGSSYLQHARGLDAYNLYTIVRLPNGVFSPYTPISTNVLFFDRSGPTRDIWYFEHPLPEGRKNYTKTHPLQFEEFDPMFQWWHERSEGDHSWRVSADHIRTNGYNLDLRNPATPDSLEHLLPSELAKTLLGKEHQIVQLVAEIQRLVSEANL